MKALTALLLLVVVAGGASAGSSRLPVIQKAADFTLMDQNGTPVTLSKLKEDVLLVGFIFTTCNGTCPATTHRMAKVHEELKIRGMLAKGKVRLLSITLDPERDTPSALKHYMQIYEIDPAHWSFLTGPVKTVEKTIADWGMWVKPAANGQLDHPSRIFLVDQKRNVREIYNLSFLKTSWVVEDIELLLKESGQ
jgi:protein SCO1/2